MSVTYPFLFSECDHYQLNENTAAKEKIYVERGNTTKRSNAPVHPPLATSWTYQHLHKVGVQRDCYATILLHFTFTIFLYEYSSRLKNLKLIEENPS